MKKIHECAFFHTIICTETSQIMPIALEWRAKMNLREYLQHYIVIADGAMGTYYTLRYGEKQEDIDICELANLDYPERIKQIHKEYIEAGANLIRTNTFAVNQQVLNISEEEQKRIIKKAVSIAKEAIKESQREVFIAGDIGPIPQNAQLSKEEIIYQYQMICDCFLEEGIDCILFETFLDYEQIKKLARYIKEKKEDCFIITNFCLNKNGYTMAGNSAYRLLEEGLAIKEIDVLGFNCGIGSAHMKKIIEEIQLPIEFLKYMAVFPNAGYPEQMLNRMLFFGDSNYFSDNMKKITEFGVDIIGGCCGTTPEYIRELVKKISIYHTKEERFFRKKESFFSKKTIFYPEVKACSIAYNSFSEKLKRGEKVIAVELDPPFDTNYNKLIDQAKQLKEKQVDIITMADSPMGRSRVDSILMSIKLQQETNIHVMPHICCRDKNMIAMRSGLLGAYINGIRNLLVVTGDPVPNVSRVTTTSVFDYNSIQLMSFIKQMNEEHAISDPIFYGGALNYSRGSMEHVIRRTREKIEAGASYFLTQPVFSREDIEKIKEIKEKVDTKILCGIMPLVSWKNAVFIQKEIAGVNVPDYIVNRYKKEMTKEEAEWVGAAIANEIIEQLSDYADGYYFMLPFNRISLMDKIQFKSR